MAFAQVRGGEDNPFVVHLEEHCGDQGQQCIDASTSVMQNVGFVIVGGGLLRYAGVAADLSQRLSLLKSASVSPLCGSTRWSRARPWWCALTHVRSASVTSSSIQANGRVPA
jgi:hypothetical protein